MLKNEGNENESVVTMCLIGGMFIIGGRKGFPLGERLIFPRIWHLIKSARNPNATDQEMLPLPGMPLSVSIPPGTFSYPVPLEDKEMHELYARVTKIHTEKPPEPGKAIVTPGMAKAN